MPSAESGQKLRVLAVEEGSDSRTQITVQRARELGMDVPCVLPDGYMIDAWVGNIKESPLIKSLVSEIVTQAHTQGEVDVEKVRLLEEVGLLKSTTEFRKYEGFPGEETLLEYELSTHGLEFLGRLGFDENFKLITIELINIPGMPLEGKYTVALRMYRSLQEGWRQLRP